MSDSANCHPKPALAAGSSAGRISEKERPRRLPYFKNVNLGLILFT